MVGKGTIVDAENKEKTTIYKFKCFNIFFTFLNIIIMMNKFRKIDLKSEGHCSPCCPVRMLMIIQ